MCSPEYGFQPRRGCVCIRIIRHRELNGTEGNVLMKLPIEYWSKGQPFPRDRLFVVYVLTVYYYII